MKRQYTVQEFREVTQILRKYYPNASLTTDVIVGFPGETDQEFNKTYEFLKEISFYRMHVFKYSPRKGTLAASMPNQIDGKIKEKRSKMLISLSEENEIKYNEASIGKVVEVLFEEEYTEEHFEDKNTKKYDKKIHAKEKSNKNEKYIKGHTTNYMVVNVKQDEGVKLRSGIIKQVEITNIKGRELLGELSK